MSLLAVGPRVDPELRARDASDEKVAVALVSDHAAMPWVVGDGVADIRAFDVPVVVEEDTADVEARRARHLDIADEPVAREVDVIREFDRDTKPGVLQRGVGDQRILDVTQLAFPAVVVNPGELAVDEEPGPAEVAHGLVRVANPRKVDVANRIVGIETNQHVAVSDDEASGHALGNPKDVCRKTRLTTRVSRRSLARLESRTNTPSQQHRSTTL